MIVESPVLQKRKARNPWWLAQLRDLAPKLLLGIAIVLPLELSIQNGLIYALGRSPALAFFMVGSFVIHMWTKPGWREILGGIAASVLLALGYTRVWGGPDQSFVVTCGSFLGVGSLAVLAVRALQLQQEERKEKFLTLLAASVLPFVWIVTAYSVFLTTKLYPSTYDLSLYAFDGSLGFQPSFWAARLFLDHHLLQQVCAFIYLALPLAVSFIYAWHRMNRRRLPVNVLMLFLTTSAIGYQLYYFCPATGPLYAFGNAFPLHPPDLLTMAIQPLQLPSSAPRNAMPSLHAAAALLVFWNSSAWPKWARALTGLFLTGTLLATLGLGEHYLVDLVVAVPLSLALQAGWTTALPWKAPLRRNTVIAASLGVILWLFFLRIGPPLALQSLWLGWAMIAATIIPSILLRHRLHRTAMSLI